MTLKTNQTWTMDVRVRERNLKSGALTEKDLEKYLGSLSDLADQAEAFGTPQPALAQPQSVAGSDASGAVDDSDDDDVDDDDVDDVEGSEEAAPAGVDGPSADGPSDGGDRPS